MPTTPPTASPDTGEMVVIHTVFRQLFGDLPGLVRAVTPGDTARAGVLVELFTEVATGLHHHHTAEDELLWPKLLDRTQTDRAFVLRAEEQHERVQELLGHGRALALEYAVTADAGSRDRLAATLDDLAAALAEHLADEEQYVLPMVEQHLSVAEWNELGERGRAGIPKDRLLVQLGWILDGLSASEQHDFLRKMPLHARVLWRLVGRRRFAAEKRRIYGH